MTRDVSDKETRFSVHLESEMVDDRLFTEAEPEETKVSDQRVAPFPCRSADPLA